MKARLASRRMTCAASGGCLGPLRATWYPGHCRICLPFGSEAGFLASLGIPPREILDASGRCPQCGKTWSDDDCHVCGGPGEPRGYWESLTGAGALDDPSPCVAACANVFGTLSVDRGEIPDESMARFLTRHGVTDPEERDEWTHRTMVYAAAYRSALAMGEEASRPKPPTTGAKGARGRR